MIYEILALVVVLFGLLASGLWVGMTLMLTSVILLGLFRDIPLDKLVPQYVWNTVTTHELLALPLFILMGEILYRTNLSRSLFSGISPWVGFLPGRLAHVNVAGCTIFAAISGSSAATTQIVGRMSLAEMKRRGYSDKLAIGSLAGAGTLGFLIPPSNILIIYGVLAEVSILKLFAAGIVPGLLLALAFMSYIIVCSLLDPTLVPKADLDLRNLTWAQRFASLHELLPVIALIFGVLGSMYGGIATPTEAASVGVIGALIIAIAQKSLSPKVAQQIIIGAALTCSMIAMIMVGATMLGNVLAMLGIPQAVAGLVAQLELTPMLLIALLVVIYLILGCFLDGFSMIVLTLPVVLPIIGMAEISLIWFGIFLVLVVETAQITPPVGFNLFVIQGMTKKSVGEIALLSLPFLLIMITFVGLVAVFPDIVLFLPRMVYG